MITKGIDEAAVLKEFHDLQREIGCPVVTPYYSAELVKDGEVIQSIPRTLSHSFNRNAYNYMVQVMGGHPCDDSSFGAGYMSAKDYLNNIRYDATATYALSVGYYGLGASRATLKAETLGRGYRGNIGIAYHGIVVGTGSGAESFDGYNLTARVEHGNGAGQLHHADMDAPVKTWTAGTLTWTAQFIRYFSNNSGGQIDIDEIGMYGAYMLGPTYTYYIMVTRDLLGATINMVDASQLKVTYEVDLVLPE